VVLGSKFVNMETHSSSEHVAATVKVFVACIPSSIVIYRFRVEDHLIVGLSSVAGVLLQALVPPRKLGLVRMLAATTAFTIAYSEWNPRWAKSSLYPLGLAAAIIALVEGVTRTVRYFRKTRRPDISVPR